MARQRRSFKINPKAIRDIITRQAGSLHKAILEAVMNAIEAGATLIEIVAEGKHLSIYDNGRGIRTRKEIKDFFEHFSNPHSQSEAKIWAQFRMGRGQIFSFGRNTWRTNNFEMFVDVNEDSYYTESGFFQYDLDEEMEAVQGCRIEIDLYKDPIGSYQYSSMQNLQDQVKHQIEFMEVPIYFNGEQLNTPASQCNWDSEDEYAYYLWAVGDQLTIYNVGAYVMDIAASVAGATGVIVSKKVLKVNFARNDIQSDCDVYFPHIACVIQANRIKKTRQTRRRFDKDERIATLHDVRDGIQRWHEVSKIGLILTTSGRVITLDYICKNRQAWTFAERGDTVADKLMQAHKALCIDEDTYKQLGFSGKPGGFFKWLAGHSFDKVSRLYQPFNGIDGEGGLADDFDRTCTIVPHADLTPYERRILKVLEGYDCWEGRVIRMGIADSTCAWTDGFSHITIERNWLGRMSMSNYNNCAIVVGTMVHELSHDCNTNESHVHGEEFYRRFHNICLPDGDGNTPMRYCASFSDSMRRSRIEEQKGAAIRKERKAKDKRDAKLGIGAVAAVKQAARPQFPQWVRQPAKRRPRGKRRIPRGV